MKQRPSYLYLNITITLFLRYSDPRDEAVLLHRRIPRKEEGFAVHGRGHGLQVVTEVILKYADGISLFNIITYCCYWLYFTVT